MNPNRFTEKAQEALVAAQNETTRRNNAQLDLEQLLWALLAQTDGIVPQVVLKLGRDPRALLREVEGARPDPEDGVAGVMICGTTSTEPDQHEDRDRP